MPPRNPDLPTNVPPLILTKRGILNELAMVDTNVPSCERILRLEEGFRERIRSHIASLPIANAKLADFNTSPFVLMIYTRSKSYTRLSQLEGDILPAKLFSSMETSAGRMIEDVALPVYGWQGVPSGMHTANSALDGKQVSNGLLKAATLKSGPRCLNDEMSENFADNVIEHGSTWLASNGATQLDFTYGVLYGTKKQSNKKDWHILRNIAQKLPPGQVTLAPRQIWHCEFVLSERQASATVRVGKDWWDYLGGPLCLTELCVALIRACVSLGQMDAEDTRYHISDLGGILAWPQQYPRRLFRILQESQLPWLFFLMRHFCDELQDGI